MKKNVILLFIFTFTIVLTLSSFKVSASSYNVNLASPDLTDKEHLGNGVYRLSYLNGITIDYNVYNGEYELNGTATTTGYFSNYLFKPTLLSDEFTIKIIYISGLKSMENHNFTLLLQSNPTYAPIFTNLLNGSSYTYENQNDARLYTAQIGFFTNYKFKLQLEKGTILTPYKLPMDALRQHQELISGDLPNNFFQVLYDLMKDFIRSIAFVWIWLNDPIKIGFELPIIGYIGIPPFTPLSAFGIGILVVIGLWAVKSLVPMG